MFLHMLPHSVDVLEESHMAQLIQLVMADRLIEHVFLGLRQVCLGSSQRRDTGTGEAYLGSGDKFINHIRISCFLTFRQKFQDHILIIVIQMVNGVSVIPENTEVFGSRFQMGKSSDCLVGERNTGGILIFWYAPDSLDGLVFSHQLFHYIHIWAGRKHGNIDHLNAKIFRHRKMTVISRNRTQEFYLVQFRPGGTSHNALGHGTGNCIKHNAETGVSVN